MSLTRASADSQEPLFHATSVTRRVALRAWPLVQSSSPRTRLEDWLAYAAAQGGAARLRAPPAAPPMRPAPRRAGLVALEDARGYIHALFAWHVHRAIGHPRTLRVTDLVVGSLPGRPLAESLAQAIRQAAAQARADNVVVEMGERQIAPDALLSDGFEHLVLHCMRRRAPPAH